LEEMNAMRDKAVHKYIERLEALPDIVVPFVGHRKKSSFHLFPILLPATVDRDFVMRALKEKGIQTSIHYPAVHLFSKMRKVCHTSEGLLKVTEKIAKNVLTLPLYPGISEAAIDYVAECLSCHVKK